MKTGPNRRTYVLKYPVSGREHSDHTIGLTNHPRVYRLDVRDVLKGMLFGDDEPLAASNKLRNYRYHDDLSHRLLYSRYLFIR